MFYVCEGLWYNQKKQVQYFSVLSIEHWEKDTSSL